MSVIKRRLEKYSPCPEGNRKPGYPGYGED